MKSIDELLLSKDFSELSDEEKDIVLKQFSPIEYDSYRKLILKSKKQFQSENADLIPDPSTLNSIKSQFKNQTQSARMSILKYPVPAYQFASVAAMLLVVVWLFFNRAEEQSIPVVQYVYKTDTVFVPAKNSNTIKKSVPAKVNTTKNSTNGNTKPNPVQKNEATKTKKVMMPLNNYGLGLQVNIDEFMKKQNYGENFSTNQDLKQFIAAVN